MENITIVEEILITFKEAQSIKATAKKVGCSNHRVKKLLSSNGIIINDTHQLILKYKEEGKTPKETAQIMGISEKTVMTYLPAVRPLYLINPSDNAKKIKRCRERKNCKIE